MIKKRIPFWQNIIETKYSTYKNDFKRPINGAIKPSPDSPISIPISDLKGYNLYLAHRQFYINTADDPYELMKAAHNKDIRANLAMVFAETFALCSAFCQSGERVYKIARAFGEELSKVELDFPLSKIPQDEHILCVEFPDSIRFPVVIDNEKVTHKFYVQNIFIALTKNIFDDNWSPLVPHAQGNNPKTTMSFWVPLTDEKGVTYDTLTSFNLPFYSDDELLSDVMKKHIPDKLGEEFKQAIQYAFKCWVYIHSGDPDLREFKPVLPTYTTNRKKLERFHAANPQEALIPMTLVGFNFQKPIEYSKDMTTVSGHFRWQPWGARRERVKLIWIDAHERHYKPIPVLANP